MCLPYHNSPHKPYKYHTGATHLFHFYLKLP
nr:MAG TPA: hypothetical protein [Caudoviricetes sp.]